MAAGEFVSVSSQRDSEKSFLARRRKHISENHDSITEELVEIYRAKGLSKKTAEQVALEYKQKGYLQREVEKESGIDADDISSPWAAAAASAIAFTAGAIIPLIAIATAPDTWRIAITAIAVLLCLIITGVLSARAGQANKVRAGLRIVVWGVGAMAITYAIGHLIGISIGA